MDRRRAAGFDSVNYELRRGLYWKPGLLPIKDLGGGMDSCVLELVRYALLRPSTSGIVDGVTSRA